MFGLFNSQQDDGFMGFLKSYGVIILFVILVTTIIMSIYLFENRQSSDSTLIIENYDNEAKAKCILFHANWCGHCKTFMPTWEEMKKRSSSDYTMQSFEVDDPSKESKDMFEKYSIKSFPTIVIVPPPGKGEAYRYHGSRTIESIESEMKSVMK